MSVLISDGSTRGRSSSSVADKLIGILSTEIRLMPEFTPVRCCACVECGALRRRNRQRLLRVGVTAALGGFYFYLLAAACAA